MEKIKILKLELEAGKAVSTPPIGPILGQYGINIMSFCKEYNQKTQNFKGLKIPASIIFSDPKNFKIKLHLPSLFSLISFFSFSKNKIKLKDVYKIIEIKRKEFYPLNRKKCYFIILGTLKSMKIYIEK